MINVINESLTFWWLHCMHKLFFKMTALLWFLAADAKGLYWPGHCLRAVCILEQSYCRNFPFYLFSENRTFHHLFSSFLVQHLSISPPLSLSLFISLHGCVHDFVRVHPSGCYFAKSFMFRIIYLFYPALLLLRSSSLPGETFPSWLQSLNETSHPDRERE